VKDDFQILDVIVKEWRVEGFDLFLDISANVRNITAKALALVPALEARHLQKQVMVNKAIGIRGGFRPFGTLEPGLLGWSRHDQRGISVGVGVPVVNHDVRLQVERISVEGFQAGLVGAGRWLRLGVLLFPGLLGSIQGSIRGNLSAGFAHQHCEGAIPSLAFDEQVRGLNVRAVWVGRVSADHEVNGCLGVVCGVEVPVGKPCYRIQCFALYVIETWRF